MHAELVARLAQQFEPGNLIPGNRKSVIEPEFQLRRDGESGKRLAAIGLGAADVGEGGECLVDVDQIGDVVLVLGRTCADHVIEKRLLEPRVKSAAFLRL